MQLEETIAKELACIIKEQFAVYDGQIKSIEAKLTAANVKIAALETRKPEKGERGEKGDKGDAIVGPEGRAGVKGDPGKDGVGIAAALIDRENNFVLTMTDGTSKSLGCIKGADGAPGPVGPAGIDGKDGAGPSRGRHRGPWTHNEKYHLDDSVTSGGSGWIAIVDNPKSRPGDSDEWQLFVRKGRDGKDGERGPMGPPGPPGKDSKYA